MVGVSKSFGHVHAVSGLTVSVEADDFAEWIVVIGQGRLLADRTPSSIKSSFGMKVIRSMVPGARPAELAALPGAVDVDVDRGRAQIRSRDAEATVRALLDGYPDAFDLEVSAVSLEDAFLALTTEGA